MNTEEAATVLQIASTLDESEDKNLMTVATILRGMLGEIQRLGTESDKLRADLAARDAEIKAVLEAVRDGSANPDRTMTVLGLENAVAAIHKFALYELKKHEGAKS